MSATMFQNFDRHRPLLSDLCTCGKRRGQHRYGDEVCPNPRWKAGNGEPQWTLSQGFYRVERETSR